MGGGPVHLMNQLVWGVDLVEEQMLASAGIPSRPYISNQPNNFVAEYSVNAKHTGLIKNLDFLKVCAAACGCCQICNLAPSPSADIFLTSSTIKGCHFDGFRRAYPSHGIGLLLLCLRACIGELVGGISSCMSLQEWQDDKDVVYCRPLVEVGDKVVAIEDGMPTWLYEVLVTRPDIHDAIRFVNDIEKAIEPYIPIELRRSKEHPEAPDLPQEQ